MKYRDSAWIAEKLADAMYDRWRQLARAAGPARPTVVTSVPMSAAKRRVRGYDQAEVIARRLSRLIGAPFAEGMLKRSRETVVMSALGAQERRENMAGAFEVDARARDLLAEGDATLSDVTLVDDVFTTGNTADACAAALKEAGVERVTLFTFAAGTDTDPPSRDSDAAAGTQTSSMI
jgi:ComF family protein